MQRKFLSNLSILLLLNLLVKPFYLLVIEAGVQNELGSAIFGNYSALLSLTFLLNIFLDMGVNGFTSKTLASEESSAEKLLSGILGLRLLMGVVYFILLFGTAILIGYQGDDITLLWYLGINQLLSGGVLYLRSILAGLMEFKKDAIISIMDRALIVIILIPFILLNIEGLPPLSIQFFIYAQTVGYALTLLVALFFVLRKTGRIRISWQPTFNRQILKNSFPYALLVLLMMFYYKTDSIMLERMLPEGDYFAGIYARGFRLFEAGNMIGYLFAVLLLPIFSKSFAMKRAMDNILDHAFRLMLFGSTIALFCSWFWAESILNLIYTEDILPSIGPFQVLMTSFFFLMLGHLWSTLLTAHGSLKSLNMIAIVAVVVNIILNFTLIPKYTALGSAVASLITQALAVTLQWLIAMKRTGVRLSTRTIRSGLVFVIISGVSAWGLTIIPVNPLLSMVAFPILAFIIAWLLGIFRYAHLKAILQEKD
jgi:O-antigen/teichoic acid export membrane protein